MSERGKWDGMLAIARFNWPFYVAAVLGILIGLAAIFAGGYIALVGGLAVLGSLYFLTGSLGVSHWVYDVSDVYRWKWLKRALESHRVEKIVFCHAGFDETSERLRKEIPAATWTVLDHYDPATMTEASVQRARKQFPPTSGTVAAKFDLWPLTDTSGDAVFGLFAIHELRSHSERASWFSEARRCLAEDGRVILMEHVRDVANFVAFGPGFLHFHSVEAWRKSWESGGLTLADGFRVTPFVRVFVLKKS